MTFHEFKRMSQSQQIDLLMKEGIRLDSTSDLSKVISLYQYETFYVEVYYNKMQRHITGVKPFKQLSHLDPYLEKIDITSLLQS